MDYWVVSVFHSGLERQPQASLFATPFQAQTQADKNNRNASANSLYTYASRPATWREREERMFTSGVYQPPVWADEAFWSDSDVQTLVKDHFVHVSHADPSGIAFTEDERKGEADRQTFMRPGKYLQKFLGAGPSGVIEHGPLKGLPPRVTKMKIAFYAAWHQAGARPPSDDVLEITEDETRMVEAYEEGPDSCMMGKGWSFENHPVRVYAGGGLALAILLCSASGEVIGRALCWPSKEVFGRVYPTPNSSTDKERYDELMARLKAKGWTSIDEDNEVFEGALLRRLTNRWGSYMMPYLDHEYGVEHVRGPDGSWDWWRMTTSEDHQDNTDGTYTSGEPDWTCDCCGDGFSDDDSSYTVYRGWRVTRPGHGYGTHEETWCESCREYNTFYCDGAEEYFRDSEETVEVGYSTYHRGWFDAHGGYQCSWSEEHHFADDDPPVTLMDGSVVHPDNVEEAAFRCLWDGQLWPRHFMSEAVPGYCVNADCLDVHPIQFETALPYFPLEEPDDWVAWATGLAMASAAPPAEAEPDDPVVIDLVKSGLKYDPAHIRNRVQPLLHASFTS